MITIIIQARIIIFIDYRATVIEAGVQGLIAINLLPLSRSPLPGGETRTEADS